MEKHNKLGCPLSGNTSMAPITTVHNTGSAQLLPGRSMLHSSLGLPAYAQSAEDASVPLHHSGPVLGEQHARHDINQLIVVLMDPYGW